MEKRDRNPDITTCCASCLQRPDRLMREPEMLHRTGHKRASARDRMNKKSKRFDPDFPQPIPLAEGSRAVGFSEAQVDAYIRKRIERGLNHSVNVDLCNRR